MKNALKVFIFSVIFSSCVAVGSIPSLVGSTEMVTIKDKSEFLELNSGEIIQGNLEKTPGGRGMDKNRIGKNFTIDGKKYQYKEIVAFQKGNTYYRKSNYRSLFAERIIKGKINGYRIFDSGEAINSNGGSRTFTFYRYFIQKGNQSKLLDYDQISLKSMIGDSKPAMDFLINILL